MWSFQDSFSLETAGNSGADIAVGMAGGPASFSESSQGIKGGDRTGDDHAGDASSGAVEGGTAFAILARAAGAANTLETATSQPMTHQHLRIAQTRLEHWREQIRRLSGRVVRHRLFVPVSGPVRRSVVSGE